VVGSQAAFALHLALQARRESQTWDEGCHIFAGYNYWTRADFGVNPEHPPLVKLLAGFPLLGFSAPGRGKQAWRFAAALVGVAVLSVTILWSFYGFRYAARPSGLKMSPTLAEFAGRLQRPSDVRIMATL
jgi:hypothetical protein